MKQELRQWSNRVPCSATISNMHAVRLSLATYIEKFDPLPREWIGIVEIKYGLWSNQIRNKTYFSSLSLLIKLQSSEKVHEIHLLKHFIQQYFA